MMVKVKLKVGENYLLSQLSLNSTAEIVDIKTTDLIIKRHMYDMGMVKGTVVQVKKIAPFGEPIIFKVRDYELGLRLSELNQIVVRLKS